MSRAALQLAVVLKDGPVRMDWHDGRAINHTELLWSGITTEHRPPRQNDAFYWLTVSKAVVSLEEVEPAEAET